MIPRVAAPAFRVSILPPSVCRRRFSAPFRMCAVSTVTTDEARGRVPKAIWARISEKMHMRKDHPLCILRESIESYFENSAPRQFYFPRDLNPVVGVEACFDQLLVPADHISRAESDTYYVDDGRLLRAHMTAHDVDLLRAGHRAFLSCGDVYRRDSVDKTHYPVFHQVDGVKLFDSGISSEAVVNDLKRTLEGLAAELFGSDTETRWVDGEFPFTFPSFEMEVYWRNQWLEVLGCGELQRGVLDYGNVDKDTRGWAFGLGLERLAMVLFQIPDIRLFWTKDSRFHEQFKDGNLMTRFKPYSAYPAVCKDISFWVNTPAESCHVFHENDVHECAREVAGDLVESVERIDSFEKAGRVSHCFRVTFRSMDRSLTHMEINELLGILRSRLESTLPITLR